MGRSIVSLKDLFPRILTRSLLAPIEDIQISTENLRHCLLQEGLDEEAIRDYEQIMLSEFFELQNQLNILQQKQFYLMDTLRQLEAEKVELETTVVDETQCWSKGRNASGGSKNGRYNGEQPDEDP